VGAIQLDDWEYRELLHQAESRSDGQVEVGAIQLDDWEHRELLHQAESRSDGWDRHPELSDVRVARAMAKLPEVVRANLDRVVPVRARSQEADRPERLDAMDLDHLERLDAPDSRVILLPEEQWELHRNTRIQHELMP
jgi:hypothetical protein